MACAISPSDPPATPPAAPPVARPPAPSLPAPAPNTPDPTTAAVALAGAAVASAPATASANAADGAVERANPPKRCSRSSRTLARARDSRLRTASSLSPSNAATCRELWPSR